MNGLAAVAAIGNNFVVCTTNNCNSPASDTCPITSPPYAPLACLAAAPPSGISPAPIACYSNIAAGGVPELQAAAVPGSAFCIATTVNCQAALVSGAPAFIGAVCKSTSAGAVRVYSGEFRPYTGFHILLCRAISALPHSSPSPLINPHTPHTHTDNATLRWVMDPAFTSTFYPPSAPERGIANDVIMCASAGCNAPTKDACALATAPVVASVSFSNLPDSAMDSTTGKLSTAGLTAVRAAISAAVSSTVCSTCTATVTKIVDKSTNAVVFGVARRLALGTLVVTFSVSGASTATLASVAAASTAPAFFAAATTALVAAGGASYSSASASSDASSSAPAPAASSAAPALLGLLALLALLVVVPAAYFLLCKKGDAKAASKVASSASSV
jgi:hypothetical protein